MKKKKLTKEQRKESIKNYLVIAICSLFCIAIALGYFKIRAFFADEINECGNPQTVEQDILNAEKITLLGLFFWL